MASMWQRREFECPVLRASSQWPGVEETAGTDIARCFIDRIEIAGFSTGPFATESSSCVALFYWGNLRCRLAGKGRCLSRGVIRSPKNGEQAPFVPAVHSRSAARRDLCQNLCCIPTTKAVGSAPRCATVGASFEVAEYSAKRPRSLFRKLPYDVNKFVRLERLYE